MRSTFVVAFVVLAVSAVGAGQTPRRETSQSNVERQLTQLERKLANAAANRDTETLESLTADDFVGYNPHGEELTKAKVLAQMTDPELELETLQHEDIRVRVFGDAAVATAVTVLKARYKGQDVSGCFRYMRVWVKREGRWQAVSAQSTVLPQP